MPSRAYTSFLRIPCDIVCITLGDVSMPSRAYTSFLQDTPEQHSGYPLQLCQCPLGLIPHFYKEGTETYTYERDTSVNALSGLYLISTERCSPIYKLVIHTCQCPLGLIPHFYGTPSKT